MGSMKRALLALTLSLGAAGAALAATSVTEVITTRQANLKDMGKSFKAINDTLKTDAPDLALIGPNAAKIKKYADALPTWFPKGSGPEAGVKTAAKPEIWAQSADFAAAAKRLQVEAAKFSAVAGTKDIDAIKAQAKATGEACGGCHKPFRVKDS